MGFTLKGLFQGGLKGLGDSAKDIIAQVAENKMTIAEAQIVFDKEMNRHAEAMEASANEMVKIHLEDVANARALQIAALGQTDLFSRRYIYYLASFIVVSATAFGVMLFFVDVPEHNKRLVEMFSDVYLFGGAMLVLSYFFGATFKDKTKT